MPRKQKKYHYIYKTTCNVTKRFYIGMHSTDNLNDGYLGSGKQLWRSINKHGKEKHICERLEFLKNREKLKEREIEIVNENFIKDLQCMNLKVGGYGGFSNEEHKQKFLKAGTLAVMKSGKNRERINWLLENDKEWVEKLGKKISNSLKQKYLKGWKTFEGKKHTEKTKEKMRMHKGKQNGNKNSQFGTHWITNEKINKKIKKDSLIPKGWKLGRKNIKRSLCVVI